MSVGKKISKPDSKAVGKPAGKPARKPAAKSAKSAAHAAGKQVTITLTRSMHGQLKNIAASVRGLGLRRMHQSVMIADTPENRGMMHVAGHLLKVEQN
jgi:large subunit ribosomal protein L30